MNKQTAQWIDEHREEMIETLRTLVSFPSRSNDAEAAPGAPFGKPVKECLEAALKTAKEMGFETKDLDGYCGIVDYGEGEEILGILAHLDIVPVGNGWTYPPLGGEIHDGYIYGRGVTDDKGPAVSALYGLKAVKEAGLPTKRRIRLILGCDEEVGMRCLQHYKEVEPEPDLAFSPDAAFPLINSEKRIFGGEYGKRFDSKVTLKGGTAPNVVCGLTEAFVPVGKETVDAAIASMEADPRFVFETAAENGGCRIKITGVPSHASVPSAGCNAHYAALDLFSRLPLPAEDLKTAKALFDLLKYNYYGEEFGLDFADSSGRLTMNVGIIDWDESGIERLTVDIRAPSSSTEEFLAEKLVEGFAKAGVTELKHTSSAGYYRSPDCELVSKLMEVYDEHFHTGIGPQAIGGGTYARYLKNAVAFGGERITDPSEAVAHMPNEKLKVADFIDDAKVYADAIIALACK